MRHLFSQPLICAAILLVMRPVFAQRPVPTLPVPFVGVDLSVGEEQEVKLANGEKVMLKLVDVHDDRDSLRDAVRRSDVKV